MSIEWHHASCHWGGLHHDGPCLPPTVDGPPSQEAIDNDARGQAQRQHDALLTAHRASDSRESFFAPADLRRLLDAEGLMETPVLVTSAATGAGLNELRRTLAQYRAAGEAIALPAPAESSAELPV